MTSDLGPTAPTIASRGCNYLTLPTAMPVTISSLPAVQGIAHRDTCGPGGRIVDLATRHWIPPSTFLPLAQRNATQRYATYATAAEEPNPLGAPPFFVLSSPVWGANRRPAGTRRLDRGRNTEVPSVLHYVLLGSIVSFLNRTDSRRGLAI